MIKDRPPSLLDLTHYKSPPPNLTVDWATLPDLLKIDMAQMFGVMPVTATLMEAAGGQMLANPSAAEIAIHRANDTRFQLVQAVASVFDVRPTQDGFVARPYALTLVPACKRGVPQSVNIDWLEKIDLIGNPFTDMVYVGFDPFSRDTGGWGHRDVLADAFTGIFTDELGIVSDGYFLMQSFDPNDVMISGLGLANQEANARYRRHQMKLYFKPFKDPRPRRLWGLESPIELFLAQKMAARDLRPDLQALILSDGRIFPTLYHQMTDAKFAAAPEIITSVDFYFPDRKLAVYYDSTTHHRNKDVRARDARIDARLGELGIRVLRLRAKDGRQDLDGAVQQVADALA